MRLGKLFLFISILSLIASGAYYFWPSGKPPTNPFQTENIEKRTIIRAISARGELDIKDLIKVGSLANGIVKKIHVKENDHVIEGQLLAELDTGIGATQIREAEGQYERATADLQYQETELARQKQLFEKGIISEAKYQEVQRTWLLAKADMKIAEAIYDQSKINHQNAIITAPSSGTVISVGIVKGERVSTDLRSTVLFSIAPEVTQMEVDLIIDERDIGQIKVNQPVEMTVDTYPNRIFQSTIHNISFSQIESEKGENKTCAYLANAYLDNSTLLLRPGMRVSATIHVDTVEEAPSISSRVFLIKDENLKSISEILNFELKAIPKKEKKALITNNSDKHIEFVWTVCRSCFQEIPIEIGISDDIYFQILSQVESPMIVEVLEADEMQKIYDKIASRGY